MANGTIYAEGQPFPMDPVTGFNMAQGPSPVAAAASATQAQQPAYLQQGEAALKAIQALMNPNLGPGGGMVPGPNLPRPIMPQPPIPNSTVGIPQGPFGTVGERKRADKQALFSSVGQLVNKVRDQQYQKKVETIKRDLEVLGNAVQGWKEGMATGNQDMIKHNATIINDMLKDDPKKAKEMSKIFDININPLADKKNQTKSNEYTDAGQQWMASQVQPPTGGAPAARPMAQAGGAPPIGTPAGPQARPGVIPQGVPQGGGSPQYPGLNPQAAAFMSRMPTTMQMDPALAMKAQMVKDKLIPSADAQTQAISKIADSIITGQTRLDVAGMNKAAAMITRSAIMGYGRMQMLGKLGAEDAKAYYKLRELYYKHLLAQNDPNPVHRQQAMKDMGKNLDDAIGTVKYDIDGKTIKEATGIKGQIEQNKKEIQDLEDQKGKWFSGLSDQQKDDIQGKIDALQQHNNQLQDTMRALETIRIANAQEAAALGGKGGSTNIPTPEQFFGAGSPDSSRVNAGDAGGSDNDPDVDEPDEPEEPDEGLDNLERWFPGLAH